MTRLSTTDVRARLAEVLGRVAYGRDRIILRRHGKDIAAVVPIEDLQLLEELERVMDLDAARAALAEAGRKGTIPWKKLKAQLGL